MSTASLRMCKLRYLQVSYRNLKDFRNQARAMVWSSGVEQYSEQSRKPLSQQWILKEAERYKGRKDRSQQRSCFRDFVQTIEDGSIPEKQIKVGSEILKLDSWSRLVQYGAFRELLGNGLHSHLQSNELVREVFGMGPIPVVKADRYMEKLEKKYYNAMCSKMRTQARGKQRDKRSDFV